MAVQVADHFAYVALGPAGLGIYDIREPTNVVQVGRYATGGSATALEVVNGIGYVTAGDNGLLILDLRDPADVRGLGRYDADGPCAAVRVVGGLAYVAGSVRGLEILDVSDPANLRAVGQYDAGGDLRAIDVLGTQAYLAAGTNGLIVLDVSDPANPKQIGISRIPTAARGLQVVGTVAYVADSAAGLKLLDVSNPAAIALMGKGPAARPQAVRVAGSVVFLADQQNGLDILDVGSPTNVKPMGHFRVHPVSWDVALAGTRAYVANNLAGLQILEVSDPSSPKWLGGYFTPGVTSDSALAVSGATAVVADPYVGLQFLDVADPARIRHVANLQMQFVQAIQVEGSVAYVATFNDGLRVLDVSDVAHVKTLGRYAARPAQGVYVAGAQAFLWGFGDMEVLDVSVPSNIQRLIVNDNYADVIDMQVMGTLAYQATQMGLRITYASDPLNWPPLGAYLRDAAPARSIAVSGSTVYLGGGVFPGSLYGYALFSFNVGTNYVPTLLQKITMDGELPRIRLAGSVAYVADSVSGVWAFDVTDPSDMKIAGSYFLAGGVPDLQLTDSRLYATSTQGLLVLEALSGTNSPLGITPARQTVLPGGAASLTVTNAGTPPQGYQWWFGAKPIAGATNATLTLTNLPTNNFGVYTVVVTESSGSQLSLVAELVVGVPPRLTSQGASQTVRSGATVTLNVAATGTAPLSYQWLFNGTNLPGAVSPSLTLANVQPANGGRYFAVVTNVVGSVTSQVFTVTVLVPPRILTQPSDQVVVAGDTATFSITVEGTPPFNYSWYKNGSLWVGPNSPTWTLTHVTVGNAGQYAVSVSNGAGWAWSSNAMLTVLVPAAIVTPPVSQTAAVGAGTQFSVTGVGTPPLSYQWLFGGTELTGQTNSILLLSDLRLDQAGPYTVVLSNAWGVVTSTPPALLTILRPPKILANPTNQTVQVGDGASFAVIAEGDNLQYDWLFYNSRWGWPSSPTLQLNDVHLNQAGSYSVRVSNPVGSVLSASATLTVEPSVVILRGPWSQGVLEGTNVTLEVVAKGHGLTYQWQQNDVNLPGATNAILVFTNVTVRAYGKYRVTVTGPDGYTASAEAGLVVYPLVPDPRIIVPPVAQEVEVGGTVTLSVVAEGTPPLNYYWSFNGVGVPGGTNATLVLVNFQTNQVGDYAVSVLNSRGFTGAHASVTLRPPTPPLQVFGPIRSQIAEVGRTVSFTVMANSSGVSYQWQYNGRDLPGATNATLILTNVAKSDSGDYRVTVRRADGQSATAQGSLLVVTAGPPLRLTILGWSSQGFQVQVPGTLQPGVIVQSSTNLLHWVPAATNSAATENFVFLDTDAFGYTNRYYRLMVP